MVWCSSRFCTFSGCTSSKIAHVPLMPATCTDDGPCQPPSPKELVTSVLNFGAGFWTGSQERSGFPCAGATSLMYVTLTGAVLGVTRTSLQQFLGAWNFALSFRREALCCLDVAFLAARTLPTSASHSSFWRPAGRPAPRVRHRAVVTSRSEGNTSSRAIRNRTPAPLVLELVWLQ